MRKFNRFILLKRNLRVTVLEHRNEATDLTFKKINLQQVCRTHPRFSTSYHGLTNQSNLSAPTETHIEVKFYHQPKRLPIYKTNSNKAVVIGISRIHNIRLHCPINQLGKLT